VREALRLVGRAELDAVAKQAGMPLDVTRAALTELCSRREVFCDSSGRNGQKEYRLAS